MELPRLKRRPRALPAEAPDARRPITRYAGSLRSRAALAAVGTLIGLLATLARPRSSAFADPLGVWAFAWTVVATVGACRDIWRVRRARALPPRMAVSVYESTVGLLVCLPVALFLLIAVFDDISTAGAWLLAAFTPDLLRFGAVRAAVELRERHGVELFLWYDREDGSDVPIISTHAASSPLNEDAAEPPRESAAYGSLFGSS